MKTAKVGFLVLALVSAGAIAGPSRQEIDAWLIQVRAYTGEVRNCTAAIRSGGTIALIDNADCRAQRAQIADILNLLQRIGALPDNSLTQQEIGWVSEVGQATGEFGAAIQASEPR